VTASTTSRNALEVDPPDALTKCSTVILRENNCLINLRQLTLLFVSFQAAAAAAVEAGQAGFTAVMDTEAKVGFGKMLKRKSVLDCPHCMELS
jgi:hypothetical protein